MSQRALFQRVGNQNRAGTDRMERGVKRRADNVYNRFIYLLLLASFSISRTKLHTRRHGAL